MSIEFENFFNIRISEFYPYVMEIMQSFEYQFHSSVKDIADKCRIEIWQVKHKENDKALVWIELVKDGEDVPIVIGTDVLRTMNEHGLEKLFFFTNGILGDDLIDIIRGDNHIIFTPEDIIESVNLINEKNLKTEEPKPKRKNVKIPSGFVLLRNYLKENQPPAEKTYIETGKISSIVKNITAQLKDISSYTDNLEDLDNLSEEDQKKIKKIQFGLLPELFKTSSFLFNEKFMYIRDELFNAIKECIIFLGAVAEMESIDIVERHKKQMWESINILDGVDDKLKEFKDELVEQANNYSISLMVFSVFVIIATVIAGILLY